MISLEEFDRAQLLLGIRGQPRPKTKRLPYTGIIQCGDCGGMVTAEEKIKFNKAKNTTKRYIYHHCTRRKKDIPCYQKAVSHTDLSDQIAQKLDKITLHEDFFHWAIEVLKEQNQLEVHDRDTILKNQQSNYQKIIQSINNLINIYVSPENIDRSLLSDEEYKNQKNNLVREKSRLEGELKNIGERVNDWVELSEKTFHFATYAKIWFEKGDFETKTDILRALGQNFVLLNGKLTIELQEPYLMIKNALEKVSNENSMLEPNNIGLEITKKPNFEADLAVWSG